MSLTPDHIRRVRGEILGHVYRNHHAQMSRLTHVLLWDILTRSGHFISEDEVITIIQDLCDRGYLKCETRRLGKTTTIVLHSIEITPKGRDLIEETLKPDPAVAL